MTEFAKLIEEESVVQDQPKEQPGEESQGDSGYLASWVGEGKKYRDPEELAKAYSHASTHIRELQEKLDSRVSQEDKLNEVLEYLKNKQEVPVEQPPLDIDAGKEQESNPDVSQLVEQVLQKKEQEKTTQQNNLKTKDMLVETYGGVAEVAKAYHSLGSIHKEVMDKLSATDPESALKFFQTLHPKPENQSTTNVGVSGSKTVQGKPSLEGYMTYSYAKEVRRTNPDKYWGDKDFRAKMIQAQAAYQAQGLDFFQT